MTARLILQIEADGQRVTLERPVTVQDGLKREDIYTALLQPIAMLGDQTAAEFCKKLEVKP